MHLLHMYACALLLCVRELTADLFNSVYYPGMKNSLLDDDESDIVIPKLYKYYSHRETNTQFTGHTNTTFTSYEQLQPSPEVLADMSYETMVLNTGKRVTTKVKLRTKRSPGIKRSNRKRSNRNRRKRKNRKTKRSRRQRRNVYGRDDRSYIPMTDSLGLAEPYSYTVKISTGCTGIIISPRHILTAAHCVHDQKDYVSASKKLTVGFFNSTNSIAWEEVKSVKVAKGWVDGGQANGPFFDYALIKLKKKHNKPWIKLAISEQGHHGTGERISFNSFDDDKPKDTMWYRSCSIIEDDKSFLYHYCDAKPGSSGSGVYTWVYDHQSKQWNRELIGVFSGNRWKIYDQFYIIVKNFNVAVRLTAARYAQVCEWLGTKYSNMVCKRGKQNMVNNIVSRK